MSLSRGEEESNKLQVLIFNLQEYFDQAYQLTKNIEVEIQKLLFFSRRRAKKDFEQTIGMSMDVFADSILQMSNLWKEIKKNLEGKNFAELENKLRDYNYLRFTFKKCLIAFSKYENLMEKSHYVKEEKAKARIVNSLQEMNEVACELNDRLKEVYTILKI